jgi:hypothetical protein
MITGSLNALPVRQTATMSPKACWGPVGRISVGGALVCVTILASSTGLAADKAKDEGIRILPATKGNAAVSPAPMLDEPRPHRAMRPPLKPDREVPPLPAPETPRKQAKQDGAQLRIIPARDSASIPNVQRYQQIYRSIPYSRLAYQANPRYREELALALLFNQFPPPPTIVMPNDSGMGQGGPMSPFGGGSPSGNPMNNGAPLNPPNWMLTVPPQWLF